VLPGFAISVAKLKKRTWGFFLDLGILLGKIACK
jgi:hypothetical protein